MADESSVAAGKRFARDMKRIREDRGFSVEDLHEETRIARSLIQSFEEGGLYDHSTFNEVYLRSFVRAYAEALGIPPDAALDGLEAALNEEYEDQLAQAHLQSPPSGDEKAPPAAPEDEAAGGSTTDRSPPQAPVAGGPEGRGGLVGPPRAMGEEGPSIGGEQPPEDDASDDEADPDSRTSPSAEPSPADSSSPTASSEEDAASEAPEATTDQDDDREEPPEPASPATAPDPEDEASSDGEESGDDDEESLDVRPSWMDEEPADEDEGAPVSTASPASDADSPEAAPAPPIGEGGETGIVGEPTALGDDAEQAPRPSPGSASPAGPAGASRRDQSRWSRFLGGERQEMLWAGLGIAVVIVVLVGLGVAFFSSGTDSADSASRTASAATDTAATASPPDTTAASDAPPPANVTLGASIPLTVLATDNVSGIRIRRDDDLRRPYWIGEGEAQVFPFEEQVTIQEELADVELFLAGYPYPFSPADTVDGLEITRSQAEAFVDTLRGAPATLSVSPDTIPVGAPQD